MGRTKSGLGVSGKVEASEEVGASLLLASDLFAGLWGLASSSCSSVRSAGGLLQELHPAWDPRTIAMEI